MANDARLVTYKLKDAIVGVNRHIDFCNSSYRIAFLKDFNDIEMVPVPHRNTINFIGMKPKKQYLIWREVNGDFTALEKGTMLIKAWSIATGKLTKANVTVGSANVDGFNLYQSQPWDNTYKKDWC
jgi:hypothetical protein